MAKKNVDNKPISSRLGLKSIGSAVAATLYERATILMLLTAVSVLIYSVISIGTILSIDNDEFYRSEQMQNRVSSKFDEDTINKVDSLKESSDESTILLPAGRRNPFTN